MIDNDVAVANHLADLEDLSKKIKDTEAELRDYKTDSKANVDELTIKIADQEIILA